MTTRPAPPNMRFPSGESLPGSRGWAVSGTSSHGAASPRLAARVVRVASAILYSAPVNDRAAGDAPAGPRVWHPRRFEEEFGSAEPRRMLAHALCALLPEDALGRVRTRLLRACGVRIGRGTLVNGSVRFHGPRGAIRRLHIGEKCFFTAPLFFDLTGEIRIGNLVVIGHHVQLITASHDIGPAECRCYTLRPGAVVIEDGCWIGARAMVMPGVTVGRGSVVAAGSLVRSDVPPCTLVAGVPARPIRTLPD
jgi:maltose O-acetyltransferase